MVWNFLFVELIAFIEKQRTERIRVYKKELRLQNSLEKGLPTKQNLSERASNQAKSFLENNYKKNLRLKPDHYHGPDLTGVSPYILEVFFSITLSKKSQLTMIVSFLKVDFKNHTFLFLGPIMLNSLVRSEAWSRICLLQQRLPELQKWSKGALS